MTMTAAAYNSLREASNAESLSYGELALIEEAFAAIPDEKLRDLRENATADDMLDEIATHLIGTGAPVFVTDDMLIPACDLCEGPQYSEGDDWNGETGNHRSCEDRAGVSHELEPENGFYRCSCGEEFQIDSEGVEEAFAHGQETSTRPWKIGDPGPQPFIWIKVEGGLADYGGDFDRVEVKLVDFDVSNETTEPDEVVSMIEAARAIPDRLAELPHDDPRWLDRDGIIKSLTEDLQGLIDDGDYDGAYDEYLTQVSA